MSEFLGYFGTVYLFGFIPVVDGLYAANAAEAAQWDYNLWKYIRWACVIKWRIAR